jgi:hypothetical protein
MSVRSAVDTATIAVSAVKPRRMVNCVSFFFFFVVVEGLVDVHG